ncbi:glycosyltransferase family 4 protein [Neomoorella thermoacetica]|uniref:glycosyltransferase family 4 protein n=1 Tax=Neomoorella thermoacetica TaxID=1525 RepID=UPI00091F7E69|nr:glycosyltransferase family 4 protein [Moorella thermoacetica]OIQ59001.1 glycogen synthase [Moorella thermoacetica]
MRIVQVSPRYHPYIGGVETVVKQISEEFVKQGHKVEVLTIDPGGRLQEVDELNEVIIRRFKPTGPYCYSKPLMKHLSENALQYDVIHAHNLHTFIPHMVVRATRAIKGPKLIVTGHYHGKGKTPLSTIFLRLYRPLIKGFLRQVNGITCVSNFEAGLIKKHFGIPDNKIAVIPNGIILEDIKKAQPFHVTGHNLLIVSRLEKYKNIHLAIRAMPYLPDDYRLMIIGEGPYRPYLEKLAANLDLKERVAFLGRLPNEEVYRWYKTCDLVINLSNLEAFGLNVIEGLAAGKPVLVNNKTALAELSQLFDGVTSVDACNMKPEELACLIKKCISMPLVPPDLKKYKWKIIAKRYIEERYD